MDVAMPFAKEMPMSAAHAIQPADQRPAAPSRAVRPARTDARAESAPAAPGPLSLDEFWARLDAGR
ncbi:hypothetical protein CLG96_10245 [Sphingomonas oleivorans]|uniref:Uncharacterized protein n=2 Tax=Sphingomonas oleivorans TaxID=1735121 RepID=A0A2T5FXC8_9SPHN|nr:hypothetical protein CLG96_10245 [Sphingomonas oleivorans]